MNDLPKVVEDIKTKISGKKKRLPHILQRLKDNRII